MKDASSLDDGLRVRRRLMPKIEGTSLPETNVRNESNQGKVLKNYTVNRSSGRQSQDGEK